MEARGWTSGSHTDRMGVGLSDSNASYKQLCGSTVMYANLSKTYESIYPASVSDCGAINIPYRLNAEGRYILSMQVLLVH